MADSTATATISHIDYYGGERAVHGYVTIDSGDYPTAGLALIPADFGVAAIDSANFAKKTGLHGIIYSGTVIRLLNYPTSAGVAAAITTVTLGAAETYWFTVYGK